MQTSSTEPHRSRCLDRDLPDPPQCLTDSSVQLSHSWALQLTANGHPPRSSCALYRGLMTDKHGPLIHGAYRVLWSHRHGRHILSCWIPPAAALDNCNMSRLTAVTTTKRLRMMKHYSVWEKKTVEFAGSWIETSVIVMCTRLQICPLIAYYGESVNPSGLTDLHWSIAALMRFGWECKSAVFSWATMCCGCTHQRLGCCEAAGLRAVLTSLPELSSWGLNFFLRDH